MKRLISNLKKYCQFQEEDYFHDEPIFYQYKARVDKKGNREVGIGTSFLREKAFVRALAEAIERYALTNYKDGMLKLTSFDNMRNKNFRMRNLPIFFQKEKLFERYAHQKIRWLKGHHVLTFDSEKSDLLTELCFIPAHLIYAPYKQKEKYILQPISTGAAFQINVISALVSGLLEIIERDSFVISYYTRRATCIINVKDIIDCNTIQKNKLLFILNELERCLLDYYLIDISFFPRVHVILTLLFDRTNTQPIFVSGLGSEFNLESAIIKSIEEALQIRPWLRELFLKEVIPRSINPQNIRSFKERACYWNNFSIRQIKEKLQFLFRLPEKKISKSHFKTNRCIKTEQKLTILLDEFQNIGCNVYYTDLTPYFLKGKHVVLKTICTEMQPLFIDEAYKCLNGRRLMQYGVRTHEPHFFL